MAAAVALVMVGSVASAVPGAPGGSDPYYPLDGNGGYDVAHYDIRVGYQPNTDTISGTTTILAKATQDLDRFDLDFLLKVSSVLVNNSPASFSSSGGELVITPNRTLPRGSDLTIVVRYSDVPSNPAYTLYGANRWSRTPTGVIGTNAPQISPWWYPSNNDIADKATYDISVAVPNGFAALSNGNLVSRRPEVGGVVRWTWRGTKPQNTYTTFLVVGKYDDLRIQTAPNGMPFITAYANDLGENAGAAMASVERTPEILEFEESMFGPYPFEAQGGIVTNVFELGFSMETRTRPVYDALFFTRGSNTYLIAHENAHQWFADSVSVRAWKDVWLHEGFANYAEWLWSDHIGEGTAAEVAQFIYDLFPADNPLWQVTVGDPGIDDQFNIAVYRRGAMTLQALRTAVGDDNFFTILRTWASTHQYGNATTADFIDLAERISGQQLDSLFNTWLYTKGKPAIGPNGATLAAASVAEPKSFKKIDETTRLLTAGKGSRR
jgi:aminopeptidase N